MADYWDRLLDPMGKRRGHRIGPAGSDERVGRPDSAMGAEPGPPVAEASSDEERERRLDATRRLGAEECRAEPVYGLIERQAEHRPEALAAVFDGQSLDYGELNRRSNRLARHLRALGVGPEVCVGVLMERSLDLPVALLAVLKAGGAFVPLDPAYPGDRLAYMLTDTAAPVVLTQSWLCGRLPERDGRVRYVCVDTGCDAIAAQPGTNLDAPATPGQLAYVIYTSGSTGLPKGVELLHRGLSNHAAWLRGCLDIRPGDRMLQCNSISFDATLVEFFAPLQAGAALVMALPEKHRDMHYLAALLAEQRVSLLNFVPLVLRSLLAEPSMVPGRLRYVACGGEAMTPDLARRLREVVPGVRLGNFYGPTETTIDATYFEVPLDLEPDTVVPIGRPIHNTWCEVLDADRQPVPVGVVGELCVGGVGVARGYLNQPELTVEHFVDDPRRPGCRLYRTGDRVRQRADGNLEFVGRTDAQVKLRGYRVELGEVEAVLAAIDGVEACAVIVREDTPGVTRLVAYVSGEGLQAGRLRQAMGRRLPEHMIPLAFVRLPRLPCLASGKIDRARLPVPSREDVAEHAFEAPCGGMEQAIAGIWQTLLGVERIGRHDNFFELGGHSLLLVTMLQRLREHAPGVDARMALSHPTPAALAGAMAAAQPPAADPVPAGRVPEGCTAITPDMFPLLAIDAQELERIVAEVPGGAANVQDIYPLLPLQEGMVFHHRLQEQGDAYLSRWLLGFDSRQRLDRFLAALQQVIDRHDAYRTAILWLGLTRPVQVVLRQAKLAVKRIRGRSGSSGRARLLALTDPRVQRLPLGEAPLFCAFIAQDAPGDRWTLGLLSHHIVNDHVSEELIWEEVAAIMAGDAGSLPEPVPFRSFVGQVLAIAPAAAQAYFQREFSGLSEPSVPFGLADVHSDGNLASDCRVRLVPQLAARVRAAARAAGISPAVLFHIAWAMVLARCSNAEDVVFGTVLSGRLATASASGNRMGLFMNTLPLRLNLAGRSVNAIVAAARAQLAELVEHEHSSLVLAQACSAVRAPSPLFTSVLNYRHSVGVFDPDTGAAGLPGLAGIALIEDEERTNYPVSLAVDQYADGYAITAQCVPGAGPTRVAAYVCTAVEALVAALEAGGDAAVATLDVLPRDEHARLVVDYNATGGQGGRTGRVVEQLAAQAQTTPEAVALRFNDASLSYRQLCLRVNRAARVLRAHGVGRGSRVGLCLPRGPDMVVMQLAILRAGGAYVPLDPEYPAGRLEFMARDAGLDLMLAGSEPLPMSFPPERTLRAADLAAGVGEHPDEPLASDPARDARDEDPAYVIYTSGSTGTPKGVAVAHRALENFLASMARQPGLTASDRWVAVTTLSFDIAVLELLLPLCVGAQVVLASREVSVDGRALRALLESAQATVMQATPSTWRLLVEAGWRGAPEFTALVGGEALPGDLAGQLLERSGELWNMYGPTETTVWSSCWRVRAGRAISIGRPIANTCIHVLDARMRPCPTGVPGEIHIGGAGLSLGYHNRAELTEQRFVANPFQPAPGARLYRTGDRGRWCEDGLLEHLGRLDFQVKLRGHRIELGEIEAVLATHPQVGQAVVVVREDTPGDARLVAYVVPASGQPDPGEWRAHLRQALPEYMLPQHLVVLASLPLAPNGKLDRAALPAPSGEGAAHQSFEAPQGDVERALAGIWQELLGVERVGRHDSFFELGGHSLLAMRLIARMESTTGYRINLLQLATGSVHSIAEQLSSGSRPRADGRRGMVERLRRWLRRG